MVLKYIRRIKALNRRKFVRVNLNCLVKYKTEAEGRQAKVLTNLVNLSTGGALLNTFGQKLGSKERVELEFQLPNSDKPICVSGESARSIQKRKGSFQVGVQFKEISKQDLDVIQDYILTRTKYKKR